MALCYAPGPVSMRYRVLTCAFVMLAFACNDRTKTQRILEPYTLVPGTPSVITGTPGVSIDPTMDTSKFGINTPRQCDTFQQLSVRKVDILWVVDNSGSMRASQANLAAEFPSRSSTSRS